jgi:hypothetical protein
MTYLSELRAALVDAAHRQHAAAEPAGRERASGSARWRRPMHSGRAMLASVALGLTGTAVGAVQVGPPLGPEPGPSHVIVKPAGAPTSASPRP